jgi:hypothetical protein
MKELSLIVINYSLFVFIFIYGLIIFFKLRRNERVINDVKRNLDALLQNSDLNLSRNNYQHNQESNAIQDAIVDNHEQLDDTENVEFIKNTIKNSKRHVSPATNSNLREEEPKVDNKAEIEENAKCSVESAVFKNKIIDILDQFDNAISFEHFAKRLSEDNSFAGEQNLVFDLIDELKEEGKIEVQFVGGKLFIEINRAYQYIKIDSTLTIDAARP